MYEHKILNPFQLWPMFSLNSKERCPEIRMGSFLANFFFKEVQQFSGKKAQRRNVVRNILGRRGGAAFDWSHQVLEEK